MKKIAPILVIFLGFLSGCDGFPQAVKEARGVHSDAEAALVEAQTERTRLAASGEASAEELEKSDRVLADAKIAVDRADQAIAVLEESGDDLPSLINGVSKFVGASTGHVEIGLIGVVLAGLIRARRNRRIAEEIVLSVEPVVRAAAPSSRAEIASRQSASAKRLVDQAQGKKTSFGI